VYDLDARGTHERSANASEKDARAKVFAELKKRLGRNELVVLDAAGGSYIKGWRYQVFCESKAVRTPQALLHVGTPVDVARGINEERLARRERGDGETEGEEPYEVATWENLVFRYEEPNGMTRWDSPLFTVGWEDATPELGSIRDALFGVGNVVRPNAATVLSKPTEEGYLYRLDRETQAVVTKVLEWYKDHEGEEGGIVDVEDPEAKTARLQAQSQKQPQKPVRRSHYDEDEAPKEEEGLFVKLPSKKLGVPVLQRLRRQYTNLQRLEQGSSARVREGFVAFLNSAFEEM
jgi:protein KTI12